MVIVANKDDLSDRQKVKEGEGMELAKNYGSPFVQTSAKTRKNVELAFQTLVREIIKYGAVIVSPQDNYIFFSFIFSPFFSLSPFS